MINEVNVDGDNPFLNRAIYLVDNVECGKLDYLLMYDRMEIQDILVVIMIKV